MPVKNIFKQYNVFYAIDTYIDISTQYQYQYVI